MRSLKKAFRKADEYKTPSILVEVLVPFIEEWKVKNSKNPTIWCPFDRDESNYVQIFKKHGYNVINSHIQDGRDFFLYSPQEYDLVISNPPFSLKKEIFERLVSLKKPWLMLMNMMAINYQNIGGLFATLDDKIQYLIVDKKVSFNGHTSSFNSSYVCWNFLEKTKHIHLEDNNSGQFFRP